MSKDYYKTLGVDKNASPEEIKKAFHKAAHKHHPDKNGGDDKAFKEANEAYQVLSDKEKRSRYDQFGNADANSGFGGGYSSSGFGFDPSGFDFSGGGFQQGFDMNDLGDIFGDFFGGGRSGGRSHANRGKDYETTISISFKESLFGVTKNLDITHAVVCTNCDGTGDKNKKEPITCEKCNGRGSTIGIKKTFIGNIQTQIECTNCHGKGTFPRDPCTHCKGSTIISKKENIEVVIPAGVDHGQTLEVREAGDAISGGKTGSLYIHINVARDSVFTRHGIDIFATINIPLHDALLGVSYTLKTHDGDVVIKIPEGIGYGEKLRIREKGVPTGKHGRGDLYVTVLIDIPKKLNKKQKELIEQFRKEA